MCHGQWGMCHGQWGMCHGQWGMCIVDNGVKFPYQRPETRDQRPETRDQRPETRDQRPETRDQRPETRDTVSMNKDQQDPTPDAFSFDFLNELDLSTINWEREIKYVGALTGSVIGSFVSTKMAWSLGIRIATVVGGSYSGAILASLGYQLLQKIAENES